MNAARDAVALLLNVSPGPLKKVLRALTPRWAYRKLVRLNNDAARGPGFASPKDFEVRTVDGERTPVQRLEEKLWGGFASLAVQDLEKIRLDPESEPAEAVLAGRVLARYYAVHEQPEATLECLAFVQRMDPEYKRNARILEIHSLLQLGRIDEARRLIEKTFAEGIAHDGCMNAAMASSYVLEAQQGRITANEAASHYLEYMSRPLRAGGHVGLKLKDPNKPLALGNLAPETEPPVPASMRAKVSVLMALYNGMENGETAIRSILEQSWRNLELVIVDDASTDDSWQLIQRLACEDERIVPIRHEHNGGAYVARNTALAHASGDYVVVNDADDWAHPQKIEAQVSHLLRHRNVISNMTFRVRVASDMTALPRLDGGHVPIMHNDYSALMVSRKRALEMGGWDPVRFSADAEFVDRLFAMEGPAAVQQIRGGMPLSFSLWDSKNLTTASATSILTNRFGSRQEYVRHYREWHRCGEPLTLRRESRVSPFPVPGLCYFGRGHVQDMDAILVSDFGRDDELLARNLAYLQSLREHGLQVAILPWPRYALDSKHAVDSRITTACRKLGVTTLVHGEEARCEVLLISDPIAMVHKPDALPRIDAAQVSVLVESLLDRVLPAGRSIPREAEQTILDTFGQRFRRQSINKLLSRLSKSARPSS